MDKAIFATGCFWCVQEIYDSTPGVLNTTVGYTGGDKTNPTYEEVCSGTTNHAEAIEVEYDPKIVSYEELLKQFWIMHDPTTLNRQGPDIGTQYRSAIFYLDDNQRKIAEECKTKMNNEKFNGKIVTEITKSSIFYPAEKYHQKYNEKMKKKYGIG